MWSLDCFRGGWWWCIRLYRCMHMYIQTHAISRSLRSTHLDDLGPRDLQVPHLVAEAQCWVCVYIHMYHVFVYTLARDK